MGVTTNSLQQWPVFIVRVLLQWANIIPPSTHVTPHRIHCDYTDTVLTAACCYVEPRIHLHHPVSRVSMRCSVYIFVNSCTPNSRQPGEINVQYGGYIESVVGGGPTIRFSKWAYSTHARNIYVCTYTINTTNTADECTEKYYLCLINRRTKKKLWVTGSRNIVECHLY